MSRCFARISRFSLYMFRIAMLCATLCVAPQNGLAQVDAAPVSGDCLLLGMLGEPANLLPALSSDAPSHEVAGQFFVAPLKYDKNLDVVPWAAESFAVQEDGLLLRFTLRKGILWEDGRELTAEDVEFTYRMMIDPQTPTAYAGDFKIIKSFTVTGRYSFEVRYDKPFPRALNTWMSAIMPKHALAGQNLRATPLARKPLGCGPYSLRSWQDGASLTLAANPAYFDGKPHIDRLVYRIIPDATTMFLELKADKLDVLPSLTPQQYLYQTGDKAFTDAFSTYRTLSSGYTYMGYNLKSPLFGDVRVRRALAHAVDTTDIIKGALLGQGEPTVGPYKPGTWAYNTQIRPYPHDPRKAAALLREAGWTKDARGRLQKNGRLFSFTLLTNQGNDQRIKTAIIIQSQLQSLGIEVKIRTVEWAAFLKQFVMPGYFDAVILGWTITQDPDAFDVWHSSRVGGGLNFVSFANEEADRCLEAARSTFDRATRKRLYDRFQEILYEEQPYCFLYVPYSLAAVQKRFRGIDPAPAGIFHNTDKWWVPLDEQRYTVTAQ